MFAFHQYTYLPHLLGRGFTRSLLFDQVVIIEAHTDTHQQMTRAFSQRAAIRYKYALCIFVRMNPSYENKQSLLNIVALPLQPLHFVGYAWHSSRYRIGAKVQPGKIVFPVFVCIKYKRES